MKFAHMALAAALAAGLAGTALAQTPQTSTAKPAPSMTTAPKPTAPSTAPKPATPAATPSPSASTTTAPLDINTASSTDLDALPGIGKARAAAIIKGRPYKGKDDLLNRHILPARVYNGIKDKIIAKQ